MSAKPEGARDDNARFAMQRIANVVNDLLPDKWGFFVMAFPLGDEPGRMNYVSNANREDIVKLMREFISKQNPKNFGTHADV